MQLRGDNQGANALTRNPEYHAKTKHIHGRQRFITEMVEQGQIVVEYIPTTEMITDTLTKPLPRDTYERFMWMMGLRYDSGEVLAIMKEYSCRTCARAFQSNNELHKHLRREKFESRYIEEEYDDED